MELQSWKQRKHEDKIGIHLSQKVEKNCNHLIITFNPSRPVGVFSVFRLPSVRPSDVSLEEVCVNPLRLPFRTDSKIVANEKGQFQEVKVMEIEKGTISRS